jgi:anti-sigma factor RsiW
MDCRTFHKKLEDYLQGEMDFPARFGMERHAQQCYACGKEMKDALRLREMAKTLVRVKAPADFEAALLARLQNAGVRRRNSMPWRLLTLGLDRISWRLLAAGAAAAVVAIAGIHLFIGAQRENAAFVSKNDALTPAPPFEAGGTPADDGAVAVLSPRIVPLGDPKARFLPAEDWSEKYLDPADLGYFEYALPGPGDRRMIMRLPKSILLRYGMPSEDYFIRNVSH